MATKSTLSILLTLVLATGTFGRAHAQGVLSATETLAKTDRAFHSRTCGLVLLSAGRAQVRAIRAGRDETLENARGQLTRAFLLFRDGSALQGNPNAPQKYFEQRLSTARATQPANQALPAATTHCERWFVERKAQPDFDGSDAVYKDSVARASFTVDAD
jgi:hypothetical protein